MILSATDRLAASALKEKEKIMFKKIRKWLEKMAEQNERQYGGQKLDCCNMNRQSLHEGARKAAPNRQVSSAS